MSSRFPVNLITGAAGAGKTTAILRLLAKRPPGERWAVLINDFGRATLSATPGIAQGQVVVREVAGCICCSGQVALRAAMVALLRDAAPQRLLLEASAAARPASLLQLLREPALSRALDMRTTVCVVNLVQLRDRRHADNEIYREQIAAADALYLTAGDTGGNSAGQAELQAFRSEPAVLFNESDRFDIEVLDRA